jgi:plastocyanin
MADRWLAALMSVVAAAGLFLAGGAAAPPLRAGGTHTIEIVDFAFSPSTLTIVAGESVTWTNADQAIHTATSGSGAFDSGDLDPGESFTFTFTTPGTYDYLCTPHPSMTGSIVVRAATVVSGPAPTVAPTGVGGTIPNVAMRPPAAPSVPQLAGVALLIQASLAGRREWLRRRSKVRAP